MDSIESSKLGGMLVMFGGRKALQPLKKPVIIKLKSIMNEINIIPHTLKLTNLKNLKVNKLVNVELDIFSKYIYKYSI